MKKWKLLNTFILGFYLDKYIHSHSSFTIMFTGLQQGNKFIIDIVHTQYSLQYNKEINLYNNIIVPVYLVRFFPFFGIGYIQVVVSYTSFPHKFVWVIAFCDLA